MQFLRLIKSYKWWVILIAILGLVSNGLALLVPKLSAKAIDQTAGLTTSFSNPLVILVYVIIGSLVMSLAQITASSYLAEKVAYDLRHRLIQKISHQSHNYISTATPGRILTIMTSDVGAVKSILAEGMVTILGAFVFLIGSVIMLLTINLRLALYTISVIPFLIITFGFIFGTLGKSFKKAQEIIERINAVINETIIGASLVRVLNSVSYEIKKFKTINEDSKNIGIKIAYAFSALIPVIMLLANSTTIIILWFGGRQVIEGTLSIGNLSAFFSYASMFTWPLFVIGFVGSSLTRGFVSLTRVNGVLDVPILEGKGTIDVAIKGDIEFKDVTLTYTGENGEERTVLRNISFSISAGSRTAIVGPTAAGKTQLFYLMSGLVAQTSGEIYVDGEPLSKYKSEALLAQIGLVFQDSIVFNSSLRENVALSGSTSEAAILKALRTSELDGLIEKLPKGLDSLISERGTSLSGGQKQRLMLARALAILPRILLLDDFTARVDQATEASILKNVEAEYPSVTLVSITQKIEPIKNYDKIIVLMEGELVSQGTHQELLRDSFEYGQIYESQKSTEAITANK